MMAIEDIENVEDVDEWLGASELASDISAVLRGHRFDDILIVCAGVVSTCLLTYDGKASRNKARKGFLTIMDSMIAKNGE